MLREIQFDGIVGPSHNYAGLSLGNLAATRNAGATSRPRDAALEGLAKMRAVMDLGQTQGILLPHDRPSRAWLARLGSTIEEASVALRANALSASAMWAANAATVSPAPDAADGRCHLTVANLLTMPHRSHEWTGTLAQLRMAFADASHFAVHAPVPAPFGDEGAANHLRLSASHAAPGVELFVYGESGGPFPARQHAEASGAVARLHGLSPQRTVFARQSDESIAAGAFHADVVMVANGQVLFVHQQAFADPAAVYEALRRLLPEIEIIEVPASAVSLADAVAAYLFNAQLVSLPDGGMALVLPTEAQANAGVWTWLQGLIARNGPVRQLVPVAVRQSMANGGGPACLRLRVVADPAAVDPRFLVDHDRLDMIEGIVRAHWPATIAPAELAVPALWADIAKARTSLLDALNLGELT